MVVNRALAISWIAASGALGVALACGKSEPVEPVPIYTVAPITTAPLAAPAGSELTTPLEVVVREPDATPARGVAVRFRIAAGKGAALTDTLVATNAEGIATTRLRLGLSRDSVYVAAGVRGQEDHGFTFRVAVTPAPELFSVQPSSFASGDTVVVRGVRLAEPGGTDVLFGGITRGRVVSISGDSVVKAIVPPCLVSGRMTIAVRTGSSNTNGLSVTSGATSSPLVLAVGEGLTVRGADASCVRLATAGQRYLLVPQLATFADTIPSSHAYALTTDAPVAERAGAAASPVAAARGTTDATTAFDAMLRAVERDVARAHAADATSDEASGTPSDTAVVRGPSFLRAPITLPSLGSVRGFRVLTRIDGTAFGNANAKLRYIGNHVLLYEDTGAPAPLTDSAAVALGDLFDRTLYPLDTQAFGAESDIDENGRVIVLLSPLVNAITPAAQCASLGFVRGFFFPVDLDTRNKNSNKGEIFYALTADPKGERSCAHALDEVAALLPSTFLHEFQHMISYNQHVLVRRGPLEATWLNEGLSLVAETLGATPATRPDSARLYLRTALENAGLWLSATPNFSVTAFRDFGSLEDRGAAWLFLRWLGAQKGSGIYARLNQSGLRGGENVQVASGEAFDALFGDFALAVYADSIPGVPRTAISPRLRFGDRALRALFADVLGRGFPLLIRPITAPGVMTDAMVQGTAAYYVLTVPTGGAAVRLAMPNDTPIAPGLVPRLGVLRLPP